MEKPHTDWMNVRESQSPALEQGTLTLDLATKMKSLMSSLNCQAHHNNPVHRWGIFGNILDFRFGTQYNFNLQWCTNYWVKNFILAKNHSEIPNRLRKVSLSSNPQLNPSSSTVLQVSKLCIQMNVKCVRMMCPSIEQNGCWCGGSSFKTSMIQMH